MVTAVRFEVPIMRLDDAAKHAPHVRIRVQSDRERTAAGIAESGQGRAVGERLALREV